MDRYHVSGPPIAGTRSRALGLDRAWDGPDLGVSFLTRHINRLEDARLGLASRLQPVFPVAATVAQILATVCLYSDLALVLHGGAQRMMVLARAVAFWLFIAGEIAGLALARDRAALRERRTMALVALGGMVTFGMQQAAASGIWLEVTSLTWPQPFMETLILVVLLWAGIQALMLLVVGRLRLPPPLFIVGTFALVIGIGTALLLSPHAVAEGRDPLGALDAVFTATSATCVTGLVVRDTGADFTLYGQLVILGLIQVGGLGLVTLVAFFSLASSGGLAIREQLVLGDALNTDQLGHLGRILGFVVVVTLVCELLGGGLLALLLEPTVGASVAGPGWMGRAYNGLFHSVSAFCNAGFALNATSLSAYQTSLPVQAVVMVLILVGGLGFVVVGDLLLTWQRWLSRTAGRALGVSVPRREGAFGTLTQLRGGWPVGTRVLGVQTRLVLVTSAILMVSGVVLTAALEWNGAAMAGLSLPYKLLNVVFHSVTLRTAGFNTVPLEQMEDSTLFASTLFMFIGASPGSTGGGIKTTTVAICVLAILALLRGSEDVETGRRRLPERLVRHALVVAAIQAALVFVVTLVLSVTESGQRFSHLLFEAVSATGTVGLSAGLTATLAPAGKVAVIVGMFCGRIGPLTLVLALAARSHVRSSYRYPTGDVMIG